VGKRSADTERGTGLDSYTERISITQHHIAPSEGILARSDYSFPVFFMPKNNEESMEEINDGATAELEEVEAKSMDDTIRETLADLETRGADEPVAVDKTVEQSEKPEIEQESLDVISKPAPNTWKKEVAEKWETLPPDVQEEVARREADFHKGIEQYKTKAQFAETIERTLQPYMATIQSLGVAPDIAIRELLTADHKLRYGQPHEKAAYFQQLARSYGVDLGDVGQIQPQQQIDPAIKALQDRYEQLSGWVQNKTMLEQQQEQTTLNSEIAKFAADPVHKHFEAVREYMSTLLQGGRASDLQGAYEQAVWANPSTRAELIAEQQKAAKEEATRKAQEAKRAASVNVRRRPEMPVQKPIGSMEDTIRAELARLTA